MQSRQLRNEIEKKTKEDHSQPKYIINIIPVESLSVLPQYIDCLGILYKKKDTNNQCPPIRKFLPKKLKSEVTDEQIDQIYKNLKLLNKNKRKQESEGIILNRKMKTINALQSL